MRQRLLAGPGPCRRQQLEQAAAAENVEIVGVWMLGLAEAIAGVAFADPLVGHAGEAAFVEGDGRGGAVARVQQARVQERNDAERRDRVDEPGDRAPAEEQEAARRRRRQSPGAHN